jgi:hypothetical protein
MGARPGLSAIAWLGVALAVAAAPARADSGLLVPQGAASGALAGVRLESEVVTVRVRAPHAQVTVRQVFVGGQARPIVLDHVLPLRHEQAVGGVRVLVDGEPVAGQRLEGEAARAWVRAALVRTRHRDLARLWGKDIHVTPLPSLAQGVTCTVEVRSDERLAAASGVGAFVHRPGSTDRVAEPRGATYKVEIDIEDAEAPGPLWCPTHDLALSRPSPRRLLAHHAGQLTPSSGPLVATWGTSGARTSSLLVTRWPAEEAAGWFAYLVDPPEEGPGGPAPMPRSLCFVIDTTASMAGASISHVRRAIRPAIDALGPQDYLSLIAYGETITRLGPMPRSATAETKQAARAWLQDLHPRGGGDLQQALTLALEAPRVQGVPFQIVLVCDGRPVRGDLDEQAIVTAVGERLGVPPASIHTVGLGVDAPSTLLDRLALTTRGTPTYVAPREDPEAPLAALLRDLRGVWLAEPEVDLSGLRAFDVEPPPDALPDLLLERPLLVLGRYAHAGVCDVVLRGRDGLLRRERYQLHQVAERGNGLAVDVIERVAAWRRASHLVDRLRLDAVEDPALLEELVRLGARYGVVTEYTVSLAEATTAPPGATDEHVRAARTLLRQLRLWTAGAAGFAQSRGNVGRRSMERVVPDHVPVVVGAPSGRDIDEVRLEGVRHRGGRTFFLRTGEGWVEGAVPSFEGAESIRPGTARFEALLDALGPDGVDIFALEGPLVLLWGSQVVRVEVP